MARFWTSQELSEILTRSSPHVRYLLWELFVKDEVSKENLESKPVALAIVQRLCRSKGKDSLVLSEKKNGDGVFYRLNAEYLEDFKNLMSKDIAPEKPKPRPKEDKVKKGPLVSTSTRNNGTLNDGILNDGESTETTTTTRKKTRRGRKPAKVHAAEDMELPLTDETNLQFWFDFIKKINTAVDADISILSNGESAVLRF